MEEKKNNEGEAKEGGDKDEIKVTSSLENEDETSEDQKTVGEINCEEDKDKKIKNLTAAIIIMVGLLVGSIFVDAVQFINGGGYSERALRDSEIFVAGEKTWVAFTDPAVEVKVLTVDEEELANCPECDPTEVVLWLKRFIPTMVTKKVMTSSDEGEALIKAHDIKTVPAFVFSSEIEEADFFQDEARVLFDEKEDGYVLNATGLGIPVGKYLETPEVSENDMILGDKEAKVKVVVFSDFQCPFCSKYFASLKKVVEGYDEKDVALVYKDMPLDFHPQAKNAALAARCAGDQGKFWEMAEILYATQEEWGKTEGKAAFNAYATRAGINANEFKQCVEEDTFAGQVEKDFEEGRGYGISGTPSTFIEDQFLSGLVQEDQLKKVIDEKLAE